MFDPTTPTPDPERSPYATYERLRTETPVYRNAEKGFWALSRFEHVQAASRDWQALSNASGVDLDRLGPLVFGPGDFLDTDPPEHDELRAVVRSRFTPKSIAALQPAVEREAEGLLDRLGAAGVGDAAEGLAWALPSLVMCAIFGIPGDDRARLAALYRAVMVRGCDPMAIPPEALEAASEMRGYFVALARERRSAPHDDLTTQVALGEVDGRPLPEAKLAGMCFVLFSAGIDTVASLIGNAILLLAEHPELRQTLVDEPKRVPEALEEVLRFESPLQFNARTTTKPVRVGGTAIPAGERVLLLYGSANRDPRRWDDPDRFDITRPPKRHLAFGEGVHFCIGAPLARLQARIALERLLARHPDYELTGPAERLPAYNMRSLARLPIALGPSVRS